MTDIGFNKKIASLTFQTSGLNVPLGSLYDYNTAIVSPENMLVAQPYLIVNKTDNSEKIRIGYLTRKVELSFRLIDPSQPFTSPSHVVDNIRKYIFFNYATILRMSKRENTMEPISKYLYLIGNVPKINPSIVQLQRVMLGNLIEGSVYIFIDMETNNAFRGIYDRYYSDGIKHGCIFKVEINQLPFEFSCFVNIYTYGFFLDNGISLNQLQQQSSQIHNTSILRQSVSKVDMSDPNYTFERKKESYLLKKNTKPEKCLNIIISAHGTIYPDVKLEKKVSRGVNMAVMGGGINIYGLVVDYMNSVVIQGIHKIDSIYPQYTIHGNRTSTDMSFDLISQVYPSLIEKYNSAQKCRSFFYKIFEDVASYLKLFYGEIGMTGLPKLGEFDPKKNISQYRKRRDFFTIFNSFYEKSFQFSPNPYEYCVDEKNGLNCQLKPIQFRDLNYGITILQSSEPSDLQYTVAGNNDYEYANLSHYKNSQTRDYWRQKIVDNLPNMEDWERNYYLSLYDSITRPINPNGLYDDPSDFPRAFLSDVIELFKRGMGFTNINIIDYSCNTCLGDLSDMKRGMYDMLGSHPKMRTRRNIYDLASISKNPTQTLNKMIQPSPQDVVEIIGKKAASDQPIKGTKNRFTLKRQTKSSQKGGLRKRGRKSKRM